MVLEIDHQTLSLPLQQDVFKLSSVFNCHIHNLPTRSSDLNLKEAQILIHSFLRQHPPVGLRRLRLQLSILNQDVIDCIAKALPELRELWLALCYSPNALGEYEVINTLPRDLERSRARYPDWKLYDLSITSPTPSDMGGITYEYETMEALAHCTPSVKSFHFTGGLDDRRYPSLMSCF
ncbi:hypothetical protein HGRIS_003586 [Hohenbuehelia grisea]|uniref:Uncharacterized protein n=1 Tax=Hohenbuehelia grisea TaxID=104357 RepID=A0ABR3JFY6_9AGAR